MSARAQAFLSRCAGFGHQPRLVHRCQIPVSPLHTLSNMKIQIQTNTNTNQNTNIIYNRDGHSLKFTMRISPYLRIRTLSAPFRTSRIREAIPNIHYTGVGWGFLLFCVEHRLWSSIAQCDVHGSFNPLTSPKTYAYMLYSMISMHGSSISF